MKLQVLINGTTYEVEVDEAEDVTTAASALVPTSRATIQSAIVPTAPKSVAHSQDEAVDESKVFRSPVAGIVIRLHAQGGDQLQVNEPILALEAMKMETKINAHVTGKLKAVRVKPGDAVKLHQILFEFD